MGTTDFYKKGDYDVICDRCGQKYKASSCSLEWKGWFVCDNCYETRHPQDFVKGIPDKMQVPIARPEQPPIFVDDS